MKTISDLEFYDRLNQENKFLVVFSINGCMPCIGLNPVIENIDCIEVLKIVADNEEKSKLAQSLKVTGFPTLILFEDKNILKRRSGYVSKQDLEKWLQN